MVFNFNNGTVGITSLIFEIPHTWKKLYLSDENLNGPCILEIMVWRRIFKWVNANFWFWAVMINWGNDSRLQRQESPWKEAKGSGRALARHHLMFSHGKIICFLLWYRGRNYSLQNVHWSSWCTCIVSVGVVSSELIQLLRGQRGSWEKARLRDWRSMEVSGVTVKKRLNKRTGW